MINRGKDCLKSGGECKFRWYYCPNCGSRGMPTLDDWLKEQDEEDVKELEKLEIEFVRAIQ
jgi:hypothetical protein